MGITIFLTDSALLIHHLLIIDEQGKQPSCLQPCKLRMCKIILYQGNRNVLSTLLYKTCTSVVAAVAAVTPLQLLPATTAAQRLYTTAVIMYCCSCARFSFVFLCLFCFWCRCCCCCCCRWCWWCMSNSYQEKVPQHNSRELPGIPVNYTWYSYKYFEICITTDMYPAYLALQ